MKDFEYINKELGTDYTLYAQPIGITFHLIINYQKSLLKLLKIK